MKVTMRGPLQWYSSMLGLKGKDISLVKLNIVSVITQNVHHSFRFRDHILNQSSMCMGASRSK